MISPPFGSSLRSAPPQLMMSTRPCGAVPKVGPVARSESPPVQVVPKSGPQFESNRPRVEPDLFGATLSRTP